MLALAALCIGDAIAASEVPTKVEKNATTTSSSSSRTTVVKVLTWTVFVVGICLFFYGIYQYNTKELEDYMSDSDSEDDEDESD